MTDEWCLISLCLILQKCVEVQAFAVALEALQRAEELGLQFFRADVYHAVMKGAVMNKQLDIAIRCCQMLNVLQHITRPAF